MKGQTWLCCNEDGTYVVFRLNEDEFLDYHENADDMYNWCKCYYDKNGVMVIKDYGVQVGERHFATNLQGLEAGEKIQLKD